MEDQEGEAAIDAEHGDELDLHLGLRPAPIRRNLQLPNPKNPVVAVREDSSDLSLNMPIWGKGGTMSEGRSESEGDSSKRRRKGGNSNCNDNEGGFDGNQLNVLPYLMTPVLVGGGGAVGGFRRYQLAENNSGHGGDSLKRSISSCSRGSSAVASDYQSTSGQSGSSSDGGSHHSHSQLQTSHSQPSAPHPIGSAPANSINGKAECSSSSYQTKPNQAMKKVPNLNSEVQTQTTPSKDPVPAHRIQSPCPVTNGSKGVDPGRPPKPQAHKGNEPALLPHMPCVATTGNGPNGKRITGFLYKYNKSEVSIVCVCHGTSFSPAGFVEHAGSVGIENPLKHITVAPSTLN